LRKKSQKMIIFQINKKSLNERVVERERERAEKEREKKERYG
jgi:hypothetical protein